MELLELYTWPDRLLRAILDLHFNDAILDGLCWCKLLGTLGQRPSELASPSAKPSHHFDLLGAAPPRHASAGFQLSPPSWDGLWGRLGTALLLAFGLGG
jgi:hypothetical protein